MQIQNSITAHNLYRFHQVLFNENPLKKQADKIKSLALVITYKEANHE
jgi:hypothetical protein